VEKLLPTTWVFNMAKRMKLISENEFLRLTQKVRDIPLIGNEAEIIQQKNLSEEVLNDQLIPEDLKIELYSQIRSAIEKNLNQLITKPIPVETSSSKDVPKTPVSTNFELSENDTFLLSSIPSSVRETPSQMMKMLKNYRNIIFWDDKGVVSFFGKLEPTSNIVDLLNYYTRNLKNHFPPPGMNRFLAVCQKINIPIACASTSVRKCLKNPVSTHETATGSALRVDQFRQGLCNWDALSKDDLIEDDSVIEDLSSVNYLHFGTPNKRRGHLFSV